MSTNHSPAEIADLTAAAEEIARINLKIAELTEYKTQLLDVFKNPATNLPPSSEPYQFGKVEVKVSRNARIDDSLAQKELSAQDYKRVSKVTIDTARARKALPAETLEKITKEHDPKIEVRLR